MEFIHLSSIEVTVEIMLINVEYPLSISLSTSIAIAPADNMMR